jgi:hypothetical protein
VEQTSPRLIHPSMVVARVDPHRFDFAFSFESASLVEINCSAIRDAHVHVK